jgi:LysM repeat protein
MVEMKSFLAFVLLASLPFVPGAPAAAAPASPSSVTPPYHVVRPGETIKEIAAVYRVTPGQLRAWNSIRKPYQPVPDGVLHVAKPAVPLTGWRSWIEQVTPAQVNWDPARKCPVLPANLRRVWVTYIDFYGVARTGSVTVNKAIATRVQRAFLSLYRFRFRIQGMSPMSINAPWITDMGAVTAAYSCRTVAGSTTLSQHAYGLAIDVNPVQNPMYRGSYLDPASSAGFLARDAYRRGMMHPTGAVRAFTANGLAWGGRWRTLKDYMHFSTTNK